MDTQRNDEFLEEIKKRLSQYRFYHSLCVAEQAKKLAKKYGADEEKAFTAGLIHDIMKDTDINVQRRLIEKYNGKMSETQLASEHVWHAVSGELFLEHELGVTDGEILSAVRCHTTGKAGMSLLDKVVYIADFTSADRDYPDADIMREKAEKSLDEAMLYGLQYTLIKTVKRSGVLHPDSLFAYNETVLKMKAREEV